MSVAETTGVVLGAVSIAMLLVVLYLLRRVYVVVRRDQLPGVGKNKGVAK